MLRATFKHYKKFQYLQDTLYTNSKFFSSIYQAVNQDYALDEKEVKHTNRVQELINKYRKNSHHYSDLDPLGLQPKYITHQEITF
jgi:2-oxoglutarate dehydrogenase complex dehydrogenase (E1) component-like enzyme